MLTAIFLADALSVASAQDAQSQITFKSGVEVVTVSAAVRDGRGHVIRDLKKSDFQVIDTGAPIEIRDFYAGDSPVSLAVLLDISGSMAVGGNMDRARHAVNIAMGNLRPSGDEAALFTFDSKLQEVVSFTTDLDRVRRVSLEGKPWGMTSLFDAIGAAAKAVAERGNHHRALLVITVPVYLLTVVNPADHPGGEFAVIQSDGATASVATLADLSRWTGGDMRVASEPLHTIEALQDLFLELRHQYLITFEPGTRPGWHPLEIRTRKKNLIVHARSGYISGPARSSD